MAVDYSIQDAKAYIEAHLTEPLPLQDLARAAGYSPFHWHRLFTAVTGETLAAYIRRRRLEESARELAESGKTALDVAMTYQYDSQEAFIRAFRRQFGVTPCQYRRFGALPPHPEHSGGTTMEPKIVQRAGMTLVGMIYFGDNQNGEIPNLWSEFNQRAGRIQNVIPGEGYGFCFMDDRMQPNFWYMASLAVSEVGEIPPEMVAKTVPAETYAVFTHRGPLSALGETYGHAYKNWLPASEYEPAAMFDMEVYDHRFDPAAPDQGELDIYIPVRKKA